MAAQRNKIKVGNFNTPLGVAVWPKLNEPDYKWKPDEGEYVCQLKYTKDEADALRPRIDAALGVAVTLFKDDRKDNKRVVNQIAPSVFGDEGYPLKEELDEDGNPTGDYILKTSRLASGVSAKGKAWKASITFADPFGTEITDVPEIWGGSVLRVAAVASGWMKPGSTKVGLKLDIQGVQIKTLASGGNEKPKFDSIADDSDDNDTETYSASGDAEDDSDF